MNNNQKQAIQEQRSRGLTYSQIAESLSLPMNTVKSFCRRNSVEAFDTSEVATNEPNKNLCKQCGRELKHINKAKPKTFCGEKCRRTWWNGHRDQMNRKAVYHLICAHCSKAFESYGNKHRKFCSHACYIHYRYKNSVRRKEIRNEQRAV